MKRGLFFLVSLLMSLTLVACTNPVEQKDISSRGKPPVMYIEKAKLTDQEDKIAKLLGVDSEHIIYDFHLDNSVKRVQVNTYKLIDGEWKLVYGGGGLDYRDAEGRLALGFKNLAKELRIAIQSENNSSTTQYTANLPEDFRWMSSATSSLSDRTEILYEKEIPLVIQILTSKNYVRSFPVEQFTTPEEYKDYEHVYAITILFSQKSLSDLISVR